MGGGLAARGKSFEPRAVNQKDVEPSVVVVIVERDAAACGFEQILVLVLAAEDGFGIESGLSRHVSKADAEIGGRRRLIFCRLRCCCAFNHRGAANLSTLSNESTSAERLRVWRKTRREGNKRLVPGSLGSC